MSFIYIEDGQSQEFQFIDICVIFVFDFDWRRSESSI